MTLLHVPQSPQRATEDWTRNVDGTDHRLDGNALRGLKRGMRGYSRFSALIFLASLVIAGAAVLRCNVMEWCILSGAIGLVLTTELCHGAVQSIVRALDESQRREARAGLDMASAAGFVATVISTLVAAAIFLKHLNAFPEN